MLLDRIAAAPISWGVSEVPGWGHQLDVDRVLAEMRSLGLRATEFGPPGFLPEDPVRRAEVLSAVDLRPVGGFFVVLLHDKAHDPLPLVDAYLDGAVAAGGSVVVLAAFTGSDGYDSRPVLDEEGWQTLLGNLDRIGARAASRGVTAALHPHVGTMIENKADVERLLAGSTIGLCLDTGHLLVGGTDPVALARDHVERITHVHLKDVDAKLGAQVLAGERPFAEAVQAGLFVPLGTGDVDIAALVAALEAYGYPGWYVLEQDQRLAAAPSGDGPITDVRTSLDYLVGLS